MWPDTFEQRLQQWHAVRQRASSLSEPDQLLTVNDWWWAAPMAGKGLRWDDHLTWPGPWDLLARNQWCDLARALGIVYTLLMIEPLYIDRITLAETDQANLVLIDQEKYILNWTPRQVVNIPSQDITKKRQLTGDVLHLLLG